MLKKTLVRLLPNSLARRIYQMRARHNLSAFQKKEVRRHYGGYEFTLQIADPLGEAWYGQDTEPLAEVEFLRGFRLKPGARVFDLGAHQCVIALVLSRIVGESGQVLAVEANKHNAEVGERNKELNAAENLRIVCAAVSERAGTVVFNDGLNGQINDGMPSPRSIEVKAVTVDDLAAEFGQPDVLFIDVEGYECKVLEGAKRALLGAPDCFIEVHIGEGLETAGGSVDAIVSFFPRDQFKFFMCSQSSPDPVPFERNHAMTRSRFFLIAVSQKPL
jgi:FkbM family methyltransferase